MAETKLGISIKAEKDFFYIFDSTGVYNLSENEFGWGLPNNLIANVTAAIVRVFLPESETYTDVSVFRSLPNTNNIGFEIAPSDLGLDKLVPGVYKFQYIVTMSDATILIRTKRFFHYQPLECCISKKKLKTDLMDATSDLSQKVLELEVLLENAIWASCEGDMTKAQEISNYIWSQCGCCC
jgi:hypothetical protein